MDHGAFQNGGGGGGAGADGHDAGAQPSGQDGSSVFVSNLQWWTTDAELEALCSQFGPVAGIRFIEDRACGKSRGMAVVDFAAAEAGQACIVGLTGRDINGRQCRVTAQRGGPGSAAGGRGGGGPGRGGGMGMVTAGGRGRGAAAGMEGGGIGMGMGGPAMGMGMWPMMPGMMNPMGMGMAGMAGGFRPPPPPQGPPLHRQ